MVPFRLEQADGSGAVVDGKGNGQAGRVHLGR